MRKQKKAKKVLVSIECAQRYGPECGSLVLIRITDAERNTIIEVEMTPADFFDSLGFHRGDRPGTTIVYPDNG